MTDCSSSILLQINREETAENMTGTGNPWREKKNMERTRQTESSRTRILKEGESGRKLFVYQTIHTCKQRLFQIRNHVIVFKLRKSIKISKLPVSVNEQSIKFNTRTYFVCCITNCCTSTYFIM